MDFPGWIAAGYLFSHSWFWIFGNIQKITANGMYGSSKNENFEDLKRASNNEVGNLLRLSVEDVSIPKADIVSVHVSIKKDELFDTFKNTALTRLPVYENTLDNPLSDIYEVPCKNETS